MSRTLVDAKEAGYGEGSNAYTFSNRDTPASSGSA